MALPVLFGVNVDPVWEDPQYPLRLAQQVDASGLDFITIEDHPYQSAFYDAWTLLTFLAARTERVTFVPTVANLPLRPPAVLAKAAASLALLAGGRVQLGLGAGAFWDAIVAFGGPRRNAKDAVDALDEAIDVIRAIWSEDRSVRTSGTHYSVSGAHPGPPAGPDLGIWLGAYRPRMLALAGTKADGWIPSAGFLGPDKLPDAVARVDDAAAAAGRDPATIRKVYNVGGMIGPESPEPFRGSVRQWVDQLVAIVTSTPAFAWSPGLSVRADTVEPPSQRVVSRQVGTRVRRRRSRPAAHGGFRRHRRCGSGGQTRRARRSRPG